MKKIGIIGGGISGLSTCYYLRKILNPKKYLIYLYESSNRWGGWIETIEIINKKNNQFYLFERGPRGFRPSRNGTEILNLIEELNLSKYVIGSTKEANIRYIYNNNKLEKLPQNFKEFLRWNMAKDVLSAIIKEPFISPMKESDESIYNFISRRFSSKIADTLIDPLASGIFGGNIHNLSIKSCFNILYSAEKNNGSIVKSLLLPAIFKNRSKTSITDSVKKSEFITEYEKYISVSFKDGMSTLINGLVRELKNTENTHLHLSNKITSITKPTSLPSTELTIEDTSSLEKKKMTEKYDYIISTIPSFQTASFFQENYPNEAKKLKEAIEFVPMNVINFGYNSNVLDFPGFGYLVPTNEKQKILGVVYDSIAFPNQANKSSKSINNNTRLTVMTGGSHQPWITHSTESYLIENAEKHLFDHLKIKNKADIIYTGSSNTNHNGVFHKCIPQYSIGHEDKVNEIRTILHRILPSFYLIGNSFDGIGVSDCVYNAKLFVQNHFDNNKI